MDYRLARLGALGRPLTENEQRICDLFQDIAIAKGEAGRYWDQDPDTVRYIEQMRAEIRALGGDA